VHRCYVSALKLDECSGQFGLEGGDELTARDCWRVDRTFSADKDNAGGECTQILLYRNGQFGPHRPRSTDGKSGADYRIEKDFPTSACRAFGLAALGLLECVVDCNRKARMCLLGETMHHLCHAIEEKCLGTSLPIVSIGKGHEFPALGHCECGEEIGEDGLH